MAWAVMTSVARGIGARCSSRPATLAAMKKAALAIGIAALAVDSAGIRTLEIQTAPRVRSASLLKPLLAWVAASWGPLATDRASWEVVARPAVTISDNDATADLWSRSGEERLLGALNDRVGMDWQIDGAGEHPSLRVMVTAAEVAHAYAVLASDDSDAGREVRAWMCEIPTGQTFDLRRAACEMLRVDPGAVGVKCGWFGGERAHAAVLVDTEDRTVGAVVTTNRAPSAATRAAVRDETGHGMKLAAAHDNLVGEEIRAAIRRALVAASEP